MKNSISLSRSIIEGLRTLVFPEACIMCQYRDVAICPRCLAMWQQAPQKIRFPFVRTYSVIAYNSDVSRVVLKAKEERNRSAQDLLAQAMYHSIQSLIKDSQTEHFIIVPIPSSQEAIRRRGESFLHPIMDKVLKLSRDNQKRGFMWEWQEILEHRKKVSDQAGLNFRERSENLRSAFRVTARHLERPIIVVDDVVTTGATLKNAIDALQERKMTILGAATACASAHQLPIP